jgi:hypothetical protein
MYAANGMQQAYMTLQNCKIKQKCVQKLPVARKTRETRRGTRTSCKREHPLHKGVFPDIGDVAHDGN